MCIVIDYADPSSGNPKKKIKGWGLKEHKTRGWSESGEETPKRRQIHKKRAPLIKNLHLRLCPLSLPKKPGGGKRQERRKERKGGEFKWDK